MKFCLSILYIILTISCKHKANHSVANEPVFLNDSGYIRSAELFNKIKFDTINSKDTLYKSVNFRETDTVGKYYKGSNGHYFSCLNASYGYVGFLLLETTPEGKIVEQELFGAGIDACCWSGNYKGFKRYGDYLGFKTCSSGTGQCGGAIFLFKNLIPQSQSANIPSELWYSNENGSNTELTSDININNDTVFVHYKNVNYTENSGTKKITSTSKFTIRYVRRASQWIAIDSSKYTLQF